MDPLSIECVQMNKKDKMDIICCDETIVSIPFNIFDFYNFYHVVLGEKDNMFSYNNHMDDNIINVLFRERLITFYDKYTFETFRLLQYIEYAIRDLVCHFNQGIGCYFKDNILYVLDLTEYVDCDIYEVPCTMEDIKNLLNLSQFKCNLEVKHHIGSITLDIKHTEPEYTIKLIDKEDNKITFTKRNSYKFIKALRSCLSKTEL